MSDIRICLKNISKEDLIGAGTYGTGTDFDIIVLHYSDVEKNIVVSKLHKTETADNGEIIYDGDSICVVELTPTKDDDYGYNIIYKMIIRDERDKKSSVTEENAIISTDIVHRYKEELIKYYEDNLVGGKDE